MSSAFDFPIEQNALSLELPSRIIQPCANPVTDGP